MKHESLSRWLDTAQIRLAAILEKSRANPEERQDAEDVLEGLSNALEELKVAVYQLTLQNEQLLTLREALDTERQRFRNLFEFAPCGYVTTNDAGIIGEANAVAANMFGVKQPFLKGKPLVIYIASAEPQGIFYCRLGNLLESGEAITVSWETLIQPRGLEPFPCSVTVAVVRDDYSRFIELRWLLRDISEQRRNQELIRDMMAEYQAMLENTFDGVLLVKDRRIVRCNHRLEEILGYDREELLYQSTVVLYPSEDAWKKIGKLMYSALAAGRSYQNEAEVRRKDGANVWCAIVGIMIDPSNPDKGSIWRLQDISERKQSHALLEKDRAELEVRIKQRTAALLDANMALNDEISERRRMEQALRESETRLRGLSVHLQSVREEHSGKIAREVHDELGGTLTVLKLGLSSILDKTKDSSWLQEKLSSLVVLTDSTIKSVKRISTSLRPGMLDTLGLVSTIRWHVNEFSELTGIRHELHLPKYIRLSPERNTGVYRIIQESLTNVARHADATMVVIQIWKHKGELVLEIEDNGKGITEEARSKPKSFGILSMHERTHYLGGELNIRKAESGGTVVTLHLPLEHTE